MKWSAAWGSWISGHDILTQLVIHPSTRIESLITRPSKDPRAMLLQQFNIENSKSWRNITSFRKSPIEETEIYVIGFSGRGWGTTQTWNHGDLRTNQGGIQLHSEPVSLVSTSFYCNC